MSKDDVLIKYENEITDQVLYSEEDERLEVLKRPINWESFGDTYVSKSDVQKIVEYDRPNVDKLEKFIQNGPTYARIFLVFLAKLLNKDEDVRYVLTLVDDLLKDAQNSKNPDANLSTVLNHFHKLQKTKSDPSLPPLPFGPILTLLNRKKEDAYIISKASRILTTFILRFPDVPRETVENAFRWFVELLTKPSGKYVERKISIGLIGLRPLLAINDFRALFVDDSIDGLTPLMHLATFEDRREDEIVIDLNVSKKKKKGAREEAVTKETIERKGPNFQQIYEAVYCLWSLSFNTQAQQKLTDPKLIHNLCYIVKRCNKIKVIRISLATLRNLLGLGKNNEFMITYGLLQALGLLKQKRWGDEELETDIKEIEQALEKNVDDLTSWDRYKIELLSNKLEWSPPHKSNKFWQENFLKFEEEDFSCLKVLRDILQSRQEPKVMAIACWDVGEFVRVHPGGKRICQMLELKVPIMEMLKTAENNTGDEDCQKLAKEALTALQKMMITNWEYLQ